MNFENVQYLQTEIKICPQDHHTAPKSGFSVFVPQRLNDYRGHQLTSLKAPKTQTREELIPQLTETLHYDMHTASKCITTRAWGIAAVKWAL